MADWLIPLLFLTVIGMGLWKRLPVYDLFIKGAADGLHTAVGILPNLAAMLCAIFLMQASGLLGVLCQLCAPVLGVLGLPMELSPLVLLRPLSGSASLAMLENLLTQYGPDSRIGLIACVVMGSSETIFYVVCVYMSAAKDKRTGYAVPCALLGSLAGLLLAGKLF